jgi:hypothetical protein
MEDMCVALMRLPAAAREAVSAHMALLEARLPGALLAYCVIGSAALGAFREGFSDVDFVAVFCRRPCPDDVLAMKRIHRELHRRFPRATLDGYCAAAEDLSVGICHRFNGGKYLGGKSFDPASADAWMLRNHSVCVVGQGSGFQPPDVPPGALLAYTRANLDSYWIKWAGKCKNPLSPRFCALFGLSAVEWGVLGISRLYYTFREKDIASKTEAGEYALKHVPERWHGIVREALRRRNPEFPRRYGSPWRRRRDALAYVEYMIRQCIRLYGEGEG